MFKEQLMYRKFKLLTPYNIQYNGGHNSCCLVNIRNTSNLDSNYYGCHCMDQFSFCMYINCFIFIAEKLVHIIMGKTRKCYICDASSSVTFKFPVNKEKQKRWINNLNCKDPLKYGNIGPNVCEGQRLT